MPELDRSNFIGPPAADKEKGPPKAAYVHQDWPQLRYGPNGREKKVNDQAAADKLGAEWSAKPPLPEKDEDAAGPAREAEVRISAADKKAAEAKKTAADKKAAEAKK
jgi:hypothetical protein